jgi:hypothetical protein
MRKFFDIHRLLHASFLPDEKSGQAAFAMTDVVVLLVRGETTKRSVVSYRMQKN